MTAFTAGRYILLVFLRCFIPSSSSPFCFPYSSRFFLLSPDELVLFCHHSVLCVHAFVYRSHESYEIVPTVILCVRKDFPYANPSPCNCILLFYFTKLTQRSNDSTYYLPSSPHNGTIITKQNKQRERISQSTCKIHCPAGIFHWFLDKGIPKPKKRLRHNTSHLSIFIRLMRVHFER